MYNANSQNTQLRFRTELAKCNYKANDKDILVNMMMEIINYPKKINPPRHFIKNVGQDRIIMIWYSMAIPFSNRTYEVPLQIYIMKNTPYEPPQIFLEIVKGSAPNPKNRDIDVNTRSVKTNTLRNWNNYSNIENVMNEIYKSFCAVFPIYKTGNLNQNAGYQKQNSGYQPNQNSGYQPNQNSAYNPNPQSAYGSNNGISGGGGIFDVLNNAINNAYQQNKYEANQPPNNSIYGRRMTLDDDKGKNNGKTFGGGVYGQNNNNNSNYGQGSGRMYGKQDQNQNQRNNCAFNHNNQYNNN
jgi:hypothetical protein